MTSFTWLYIAALVVSGTQEPPQSKASHYPGKGVVLGLYSKIEDYSYEAPVREIASLGADSVCFIVRGAMAGISSTEIDLGVGPVPSDDRVLKTIRQAQEAGLDVHLLPILVLRKTVGEGEWRGSIKPDSWDAWFESYRRFILHYARLAQEGGVSCFAVGSELCTSEKHEEHWRSIIREVRQVYKGSLLYSANWDHYQGVAFQDDLDYLGVTGYGKLHTEEEAASLEDAHAVESMKKRWLEIRGELVAWSRHWGKPIVLTEVGYASQKGITAHPWNYLASKKVDEKIQDQAYRALFEAWHDEPRLAGMFIFDWWGNGGPDDSGYTARGKLAEKRLRAWLRQE